MQLARLAHLSGADQARPSDCGDLLAGLSCDVAAEPPHIWWGVSVEDRKHGLPRIEHLRRPRPRSASCPSSRCSKTSATLDLAGIHWVIVGGESGPGRRPMKQEWVRIDPRPVPSAPASRSSSSSGAACSKKVAGRTLDGRTYDGFPDRVQHPDYRRSCGCNTH